MTKYKNIRDAIHTLNHHCMGPAESWGEEMLRKHVWVKVADAVRNDIHWQITAALDEGLTDFVQPG